MHQLSKKTVRLVSSAQVITSPSSVVKECVENSLDAGATHVEIRLEDYGFASIVVKDNGVGVSDADARLMAKPHYTSKISDHSDLERLETFGFRGEALSSVASVARLSVETKTDSDVVGRQYEFDSLGEPATPNPRPVPMTRGTVVKVQHLFEKLPVRKEVFSAEARKKEELKKVEEVVYAVAVGHPEVGFTLSHNKSVIFRKPKVPDLVAGLGHVLLDARAMRQLKTTVKSSQDISVECCLPIPDPNPDLSKSVTRSNDGRLFIFVNKRPVKFPDIRKLVSKYYFNAVGEGSVSASKSPVGAVRVTLQPSAVDVNLEPNKTRVLFVNRDEVLKFVEQTLADIYGPTEKEASGGENEKPERKEANSEEGRIEPRVEKKAERQRPVPPVGNKIPDPAPVPAPPPSAASRRGYEVERDDDEDDFFSDAPPAKRPRQEGESLARNSGEGASAVHDEVLSDALIEELFNSPAGESLDATRDGGDEVRTPAATDDVVVGTESPPSVETRDDVQEPVSLEDGGTGPRARPSSLYSDSSPGEIDARAWAEGRALRDDSGDGGDVVEPVGIFRPSAAMTTTMPTTSAPSSARRKLDGGSSRLALNTVVVGRQLIKKPPTPRQLYEMEAKKEILAAEPDINFCDLGTRLTQGWSELDATQKSKYDEKSKRMAQGFKEKLANAKSQNADNFRQTKLVPFRPTVDVDRECLKDLEERWPIDLAVFEPKTEVDRETSDDGDGGEKVSLKLIGPLDGSCWVVKCVESNRFALLNHKRLTEKTRWETLMRAADYSQRLKPAFDPELVEATTFSSDEWKTLEQLSAKSADPSRLDDGRILRNGLDVSLLRQDASGSPWLGLRLNGFFHENSSTAMADLREIVAALTAEPERVLNDVRPGNVKRMISENVRRRSDYLERNVGSMEIQSLLRKAEADVVLPSEPNCPHGNPWLTEIIWELPGILQQVDPLVTS